MKIRCIVLSALFTSAALHAQLISSPLLPSEAASLEAAWASGQRHVNTPVQLRRGFDKNAPFENILTDLTGVARTNTKHWE